MVSRSRFFAHRWTPLALLLLAALGTGCREKEVAYYEVPHEAPPPRRGSPAMSADAVAAPGRPAGAQLEWDRPPGWVEQPPAPMRLASYAFPAVDDPNKADISVTAFPDAAGGLLANINRWRNQVGLAAVTEADLGTTAQTATIAGQEGWLVDFAGTPAGGTAMIRIVGAIVPVSGTSWFFKMIGPEAVVSSQREPFAQLVASIRGVTPAEFGTSVASEPPPDPHAGLDMSVAATAGSPAGGSRTMNAGNVPPPPTPAGFSFTAPAGWQQQPSTPFRVVNFIVPGPGVPAAEFYATPLTGAAGGELANVNRWRAQLKLPPVENEAALAQLATTITAPAGTFKVFDLPSSGPALQSGERARMLAAILIRGDTSWFFRLTGEINHVDSLRGAFTTFLESCRFEGSP